MRAMRNQHLFKPRPFQHMLVVHRLWLDLRGWTRLVDGGTMERDGFRFRHHYHICLSQWILHGNASRRSSVCDTPKPIERECLVWAMRRRICRMGRCLRRYISVSCFVFFLQIVSLAGFCFHHSSSFAFVSL